MDKLESLDLLDANKIAAGYYSKSNNQRVTTTLSLGKLMGSKEQYTVNFDDAKDQTLVNGEFDYLKAKHDAFKKTQKTSISPNNHSL